MIDVELRPEEQGEQTRENMETWDRVSVGLILYEGCGVTLQYRFRGTKDLLLRISYF